MISFLRVKLYSVCLDFFVVLYLTKLDSNVLFYDTSSNYTAKTESRQGNKQFRPIV